MVDLEKVRGDVHHNVQPIIGWLRLTLDDSTTLSTSQMESMVEKLYAALQAVDTLVE